MSKKENLKNAQRTFPLAETGVTDPDSRVTAPPETAVKEVKDWVDFKQM